MYRRLILMFMAFAFSFSIKGQEAMSLSDCIDYALANHTDVRLANLKMNDAEWQIKENRSVAFPQLNLGMSYSHYIQIPALPAEALGFGEPGQKIKFALENSLAGTVSFNQLLFNNSYLATIKAAKLYKEYVTIQLSGTVEKIRNSVTDAYMPALVITEGVTILDKNIENQEKLLKETKANYTAGFVEQLDVDRLDFALSKLQTERESLVRQRDILLDALKYAMNKPIHDEITLTDDIDKLLVSYGDLNPEEELNLMNRPDYVATLKARELADVQVSGYRKYWVPKLSFYASYNPSFQGNEELFWIPSAIAGLQLSMPIYDGGWARAKTERSVIQALQVDEQKNKLVLAYDLQMETARKQYYSTKQKLSDQERNLDLAERIYNASQTKFTQGVGSSFEVTQSQYGLYQSQGALVNARYDYLSAIVALREAWGKN